ncbi:MAG: hypothetical protein HUU50_06530 [Candidatus Brocadiae bacterium]|nr:hypothetical protein [Candidatus Brocadiia bacterium]
MFSKKFYVVVCLFAMSFVFAQNNLFEGASRSGFMHAGNGPITSANVVSNSLETIMQKQATLGKDSFLVAVLRYEHVRFPFPLPAVGTRERVSGNIYGGMLGFAYDFGGSQESSSQEESLPKPSFSVGAVGIYDAIRFDLTNVVTVPPDNEELDCHRFGYIVYGTASLPLNKELSVSFTLSHSCIVVNPESMFDFVKTDTVSSFGFGAYLKANYRMELAQSKSQFFQFIDLSLGFSYQYENDDSDIKNTGIDIPEWDYQDFIKASAGIRFTAEKLTIVFLCSYASNISPYSDELVDHDFVELNIELAYHILESVSLNVGYKKVFDYDEFDSHTFTLGSTLEF